MHRRRRSPIRPLEALPHKAPLPPTATLSPLVCAGHLGALAQSAAVSGRIGWWLLAGTRTPPAGGHLNRFAISISRNRLGHGRRCEKRSLTGVCFQSTPSVSNGIQHGGDWRWLLYGMIAFSACLRNGTLTARDWELDLTIGMWPLSLYGPPILLGCFPTATISVLRAHHRLESVEHTLGKTVNRPEIEAVLGYLKHGVAAVKRPTHALYDRAGALAGALGALLSMSTLPPLCEEPVTMDIRSGH